VCKHKAVTTIRLPTLSQEEDKSGISRQGVVSGSAGKQKKYKMGKLERARGKAAK